MNKPYLILIDGKLAERRITAHRALQRCKELKEKGYIQVSLAYERKDHTYEPYNWS